MITSAATHYVNPIAYTAANVMSLRLMDVVFMLEKKMTFFIVFSN